MIESTTFIRVRYGETDQMKYVYYGNYAQYYEVARVELLRYIGLSYSELEAEGIMLPVRKLVSNYHAPALYDDQLKIVTRVPSIPSGATIDFTYEIYNDSEVLINDGYTQLVFVDMNKNRPCRVPKKVLEIMRNHSNLNRI